jgi:hypoxanthine-DNA glycosylase
VRVRGARRWPLLAHARAIGRRCPNRRRRKCPARGSSVAVMRTVDGVCSALKTKPPVQGFEVQWNVYAQLRNQLWPILSALTGEDLAALPYAERLPRLLAHGFGLWDVLGACEREGSLDSSIHNAAANDFVRLRALCPQLETVGCNGLTSGKFAPQFAETGYRTLVLPSTSPAHASLTFEQKFEY